MTQVTDQLWAAAHKFIGILKALDRGDLAILKRNAGNTIAEARGATGLFYRILPPEFAGEREEEIFFLVATLYGLNKRSQTGNFGSTMAQLKARTQTESTDRRMAVLLDSEFGRVDDFRLGGGEIAYRLRQLVKQADSHEVGVDWPRLLVQLTLWAHPDRRVRKEWARSYFGDAGQRVFENQEMRGASDHAH